MWSQEQDNNKTTHPDTVRHLHHHYYQSLTIVHRPSRLTMHFSRLLSLASLAALGCSQNTSLSDVPEPAAPGLTFLYTSLVECQNRLYTGPEGPRGIRTAIPILGGNVTGPRIKGVTPVIYSPPHPPASLPRKTTTTTAINTATRRDPQPGRRLGSNGPSDRHLQRRHQV